MGDVTVIHGECGAVMAGMDPGSVDCIVTDPPYLTGDAKISMNHPGVAARYEDSESMGMPWGYSLDWIEACARLKPSHWVVFCHQSMLGDLHAALSRHAKVMTVFVWRKSNAPQMARPVPRLDCEFILWAKDGRANCGRMGEFDSQVIDVPMLQAGCFAQERIVIPGTGKAAHPCQKPLAVVLPFVTRIMEPTATILDPFAGTGTTGVACLKAGHKAILIEDDPQYIPLIHRRLESASTPLFAGVRDA